MSILLAAALTLASGDGLTQVLAPSQNVSTATPFFIGLFIREALGNAAQYQHDPLAGNEQVLRATGVKLSLATSSSQQPPPTRIEWSQLADLLTQLLTFADVDAFTTMIQSIPGLAKMTPTQTSKLIKGARALERLSAVSKEVPPEITDEPFNMHSFGPTELADALYRIRQLRVLRQSEREAFATEIYGAAPSFNDIGSFRPIRKYFKGMKPAEILQLFQENGFYGVAYTRRERLRLLAPRLLAALIAAQKYKTILSKSMVDTFCHAFMADSEYVQHVDLWDRRPLATFLEAMQRPNAHLSTLSNMANFVVRRSAQRFLWSSHSSGPGQFSSEAILIAFRSLATGNNADLFERIREAGGVPRGPGLPEIHCEVRQFPREDEQTLLLPLGAQGHLVLQTARTEAMNGPLAARFKVHLNLYAYHPTVIAKPWVSGLEPTASGKRIQLNVFEERAHAGTFYMDSAVNADRFLLYIDKNTIIKLNEQQTRTVWKYIGRVFGQLSVNPDNAGLGDVPLASHAFYYLPGRDGNSTVILRKPSSTLHRESSLGQAILDNLRAGLLYRLHPEGTTGQPVFAARAIDFLDGFRDGLRSTLFLDAPVNDAHEREQIILRHLTTALQAIQTDLRNRLELEQRTNPEFRTDGLPQLLTCITDLSEPTHWPVHIEQRTHSLATIDPESAIPSLSSLHEKMRRALAAATGIPLGRLRLQFVQQFINAWNTGGDDDSDSFPYAVEAWTDLIRDSSLTEVHVAMQATMAVLEGYEKIVISWTRDDEDTHGSTSSNLFQQQLDGYWKLAQTNRYRPFIVPADCPWRAAFGGSRTHSKGTTALAKPTHGVDIRSPVPLEIAKRLATMQQFLMENIELLKQAGIAESVHLETEFHVLWVGPEQGEETTMNRVARRLLARLQASGQYFPICRVTIGRPIFLEKDHLIGVEVIPTPEDIPHIQAFLAELEALAPGKVRFIIPLVYFTDSLDDDPHDKIIQAVTSEREFAQEDPIGPMTLSGAQVVRTFSGRPSERIGEQPFMPKTPRQKTFDQGQKGLRMLVAEALQCSPEELSFEQYEARLTAILGDFGGAAVKTLNTLTLMFGLDRVSPEQVKRRLTAPGLEVEDIGILPDGKGQVVIHGIDRPELLLSVRRVIGFFKGNLAALLEEEVSTEPRRIRLNLLIEGVPHVRWQEMILTLQRIPDFAPELLDNPHWNTNYFAVEAPNDMDVLELLLQSLPDLAPGVRMQGVTGHRLADHRAYLAFRLRLPPDIDREEARLHLERALLQRNRNLRISVQFTTKEMIHRQVIKQLHEAMTLGKQRPLLKSPPLLSSEGIKQLLISDYHLVPYSLSLSQLLGTSPLIFFDYDNTLVNMNKLRAHVTKLALAPIANQIAQMIEKPPLTETQLEILAATGDFTWLSIYQLLGLDIPWLNPGMAQGFTETLVSHKTEITKSAKPFLLHGSAEILSSLHALGVQTVVMTSNPLAENQLRMVEVARFISSFAAAPISDDRKNYRKVQQTFERFFNPTRRPQDCWAVTDNPTDAIVADDLGMNRLIMIGPLLENLELFSRRRFERLLNDNEFFAIDFSGTVLRKSASSHHHGARRLQSIAA